ncbi:dihydrodipicolinate synthase family protein [Anaerococcus porci]|uniref:dihydrodipicolinate synthase family protein n=1 Tax=Anaerococcus porci TaxID=2652269 RepID=UPI002A761801|nr:dihydrodipicolinate synthase family protein [Anaerococcus porci]MDY3006689.1 dihydrodipicolinate synthase family protein [Anaerococcus porci]
MAFICNLNLHGIVVPIVTPVDENENISEDKLRKQVNFVIEGGVNGILAFGSNGEFYVLDKDEMRYGFEIMVDEAKGRVPMFFGIGAIRTKTCIEYAKMAEELGADGISIIQPMFLKPTEEELYEHFKAIAESVPNLSVLLYNNPGRTGYKMSTNLVSRLAHDVENIIGMKDSSGDITALSEFIRVTKDLEFSVMGGKDTLIYPTLAMGGCGAVCSTANIMPEIVCGIFEKYSNGDLEGALEDQYKLNPIRLSMDLASFPVATKDMANLRGIDVGAPIKPSLASSGEVLDKIKKSMFEGGLIE